MYVRFEKQTEFGNIGKLNVKTSNILRKAKKESQTQTKFEKRQGHKITT